jgi:poly(3-hydroxyalkanoate) synthetase
MYGYIYIYILGDESSPSRRLSIIPAISRALSPMNLLRLTSRDHKELINAKINLEKNMNDMHTDLNNPGTNIFNPGGFKNVSGANDYKSVSGRKGGNARPNTPSIFPLTW